MAKHRKKITASYSKRISCAFCKGKGRDPFGVPSKLSNCQVCVGRGAVHVAEPMEMCSYCKGTGVFYHHRLPCAVCGGRGAVTKIAGRERCKKCEGDGKNPDSGLPCSSCYGLGGTSNVNKNQGRK